METELEKFMLMVKAPVVVSAIIARILSLKVVGYGLHVIQFTKTKADLLSRIFLYSWSQRTFWVPPSNIA